MAHVLPSTAARYRPSRRNPILYRWIRNPNGHDITRRTDVRAVWRPYFSNANPTYFSVSKAVSDCASWAEEEYDGPGAYIGAITPQNLCEQLPFGRLRGHPDDRPAAVPWDSGGDFSLFSNAGVANCVSPPRVVEFIRGLRDALLTRGLPFPRWMHMDLEESTHGVEAFGAHYDGDYKGFYTPSLIDPRSTTEDIDGFGTTLQVVETARVAEGYEYDDHAAAHDINNIHFNFEYLLSWPARSWALERAVYRAVRTEMPGIRVTNYDDFTADNRDWHYPWEAATGVGQPRRWNWADAHAPSLYPFYLPGEPTIQEPGETAAQLYLRGSAMKLDAILHGTQRSAPIVPWVLEPGMTHHGLSITPSIFAGILNAAWARGVYEYIGWSDNDADPHADDVLAGWQLHRAYVASHA